jgi:hypothetical protein
MWTIIAAMIAIAVVFVLSIRKVTFGISMMAGSILLGLLTLSPQDLIGSILNVILDPVTIELAVTTILITYLGFLYQETGKLIEMTENLEKIVSDRRVISMAVPALFGMLPMYGGALLSAPVVNVVGEKIGITNSRRVFLNFWFRLVPLFIHHFS